MPKFRVPTEQGVFEVETDTPDPTEEELLQLVNQQPEGEEGPGLLRRGLAFGARIGGPLVGGAIGGLATGGLGAAAGAAAGGAAGESLAEAILGEEQDPTEIALAGGLSAIPGGILGRLAPAGSTLARRVLVTGAEGAAQGVLAAEAESVVKEGELAGIGEVATGAIGGGLLGAGFGAVAGRAGKKAVDLDAASPAAAPTNAAPQTKAALALDTPPASQSKHFERFPGMAGEVPPPKPASTARIEELQERVDALFPHLNEVERVSLKWQMAEQADDLLEHTRQVQSHERTQKLSEELIHDFSKPLPQGTALNAEQIRFMTNHVGALQRKMRGLAEDVFARPTDDALKLKLQHTQTQLANAIFSFTGARSEAGRTLNMLRVQAKAIMSGDAKAILAAKRLGLPADQIARIISMHPGDELAQYKAVRDMFKPTKMEWVKWMYYTNILSGPQTHMRNLVSNTINLGLRPLTTPFAAAADVARTAVTGREREVFLGEVGPQVMQFYHALPDAFKKATFMFKNGFSLSMVDDFEIRAGEVPGGVYTNVISRGLAGADEFFRAIGFNMEFQAGAFAMAQKQARKEGLTGDALRDRVVALTADILDKKPNALMERANKFSRRVTFQEQDNELGKAIQHLRDKIPGGAGAFLLPFVRTPANILRQGFQFSPFGLLMKADPGRERAQRIGEAVLGSALMLPVAWLAANDYVTGAAPRDPVEREKFFAEGKKPNSIRVGDRWVSYTEAGPLLLPFSLVANMHDAWKTTGKEPSVTAIVTALGQIGQSTLEQSYLSSLAAVFEMVQGTATEKERFAQNLASGFVPLVGLQRNIRNVTDPTLRIPRTFAESVGQNNPLISRTLEPRLDAFGEPVERVPSGPAALAIPTTSPVKSDPLRDELSRLGVRLQPLSRQLKNIRIGTEKVPLTAEDDVTVRQAVGYFRRQLLERVTASEEYQALTDDEKSTVLKRQLRMAARIATDGAKTLMANEEPVTFEALTKEFTSEMQAPNPDTPGSQFAPGSPPIPLAGPPSALDEHFSRIGTLVGVDPTFIKAVSKVESGFNPGAVGPATRYGRAIGPMQILPSTFKLFEARARRILGREPIITNTIDNILVGSLFYRDLLDRFNNDPTQAARFYHGGPDTREHGPKTRAYGARVAETYATFLRGRRP